MSQTRRAVGGGIGVVVVAGLITVSPQLATIVKDYLLEMDARKRTVAFYEWVEKCEDYGGRPWKGNCLDENSNELKLEGYK